MSLVQTVIDYVALHPNGVTRREITEALGHPRIENGVSTASKGAYIEYRDGKWFRTAKQRVLKLSIQEEGAGKWDTIRSAEARLAALIGNSRYEDFRPRTAISAR